MILLMEVKQEILTIVKNNSPQVVNGLVIPLKGSGDNGHIETVISANPILGTLQTVSYNRDGNGTQTIETYNLDELQDKYAGKEWGFTNSTLKSEYSDKLTEVEVPIQEPVEGMLGDYTKEQTDQINKLTADYKPIFKEVRILNNGFIFAEDFNVHTQNPYDDQALIFAFMKVLDPGSIVRQSEFDTALQNASLLETYSAKWRKAVEGKGMLEPSQRQNILDTMDKLYEDKKSLYQSTLQAAVDKGAKFGLTDPTMYLEMVPEDLDSEPEYTLPEESGDPLLNP